MCDVNICGCMQFLNEHAQISRDIMQKMSIHARDCCFNKHPEKIFEHEWNTLDDFSRDENINVNKKILEAFLCLLGFLKLVSLIFKIFQKN